jgi:CheY-like chemotaxis protein
VARILIVDDEPDVRELFNITLKMAGHVTDTAKHGLEAVEKLANDSPELIVLDLMMPHMDGFGLLNHIRTQMSAKPFRVIVATAKVLEESDQEKLGSWPVVGVLNKGELDIGQMVMIVAGALSKSPLKDSGKDEGGKESAKDAPKDTGKESVKDTKDAGKEISKDSSKPTGSESSGNTHPS